MDLNHLITFSKDELKRLQDHFQIPDDKRNYTILAKLMEEVGELAQALLDTDSLQRKDKVLKSKIEHEIADAIIVLLILAANRDIDIAKALEETIEKAKRRSY